MSVKTLPSRTRGPYSRVMRRPWRPYSPSPALMASGMASAESFMAGHGLVAEVGDVLRDGQQHDGVPGVGGSRRGAAQRGGRRAQEFPVHGLRDHDHVAEVGGDLLRLLVLVLAAVGVRVEPPLVVAGDPHQIGAQGLRGVPDLAGRLLGRRHRQHAARALANGGVRIQKTLAAVVALTQFGEDVRYMPGRVAQRVVTLGEAVDGTPGQLRRAVRLVEHVRAVRTHLRVPERAAEDVVPLREAPKIVPDIEAGFLVGGGGSGIACATRVGRVVHPVSALQLFWRDGTCWPGVT